VGGAEACALSLEGEVGLLLTAILLTLPFLHIYKACFSVHVAADSLLVARPIVGAPVAALCWKVGCTRAAASTVSEIGKIKH
jgi:hypothetical protein